MKAIVQEVFGDPNVLHFSDVEPPKPRPRDLIVRVRAVSVNPVDAKVRRGGPAGHSVPDPPKIVGWDAAGIVESVGAEVGSFSVGEEVFFAGDITRAGCYSELVAIDERIVGPKPKSLSFEEAAAIPLTALTAWEGLFEALRADEKDGGSILIVGGAGGVGSIAIHLARKVAGLKVIATASRPESETFCIKMGADLVLNHRESLGPQLMAAGYEGGVRYIFSTAELTNFSQLIDCLSPLGHICVILGGEPAKALDLSRLFALRGALSFQFMFTRPRFEAKPEKQGAILRHISDLLDDGVIQTTLTEKLSWKQVQEAHRRIETGHTIGKLALTID